MPLSSAFVGQSPKESPIHTHATLTWAMNFAAGCDAIRPCFLDNRDGRIPAVHPLFLAGATEIIGFWACVYASGVTKPEAIRHTVAHHSFDGIFYDELRADELAKTVVSLAGAGSRKSGDHFLAHFAHHRVAEAKALDVDGVGAAVGLIGESWWGGILLGLKSVDDERYVSQPPERRRIRESSAQGLQEWQLTVPSRQAHVWDACIRDPRRPKAKSSDINPHTNVDFANRAGLPARTLNGLCVLAYALSPILETVQGLRRADSWPIVRRIACTFTSPVYVDYEDTNLNLRILSSGPAEDERVGSFIVLFEVIATSGATVLRDGYLEIVPRLSPSPRL